MSTIHASTDNMPVLSLLFEEFDARSAFAGYVGSSVMPILVRAQQAGHFQKSNIATYLADRDDARAEGGAFTRINGTRTTDSYATVDRGLEEPVDRRTARAEPWVDHMKIARDRLLIAMQAAHERRVVAKALDAGINGAAASVAWTSSSAVPITDVETAKRTFRARTGLLPNLLVIPWEKWSYLRQHNAQIIDRLKYWGGNDPMQITPQILANVFEVPKVLVSGGLRNSANQGQTPSLAEIWDVTKAGLYLVAEGGSQDTLAPQFGRTFAFSGNPESGGSIGFSQYYQEDIDSDVLRARFDTDEKILSASLAQIIHTLG